MKFNPAGKPDKKSAPAQNDQPAPPLWVLEVKESSGRVYLRIALSPDFYRELYQFLEQKGFVSYGHEADGIALLLEFGCSTESHEELQQDTEAMRRDGAHYAAMSFQTAEYYAKNSAIAMGLRFHLQENRLLKKRLKEQGLGGLVTEDEWDRWDEDTIVELCRRYVFCR